MLQRPNFRTTILPLILAVLALIVLNVGLYTRLRASGPPPSLALPYFADFTQDERARYTAFGGDWEVRDETLVQLSTSGYDLGIVIPVDVPDDQPYTFSTRLKLLGGSMGGGMLFNAQQNTARQASHMARFNVADGRLYLIYGYFDETAFQGQGSAVVNIDPADAEWHTLAVRVTPNGYTLLVDGAVAAENIAVQTSGGAVGLVTSTSQVAFDDVQVAVLTDAELAQAAQQPDAQPPSAQATQAPTEAAAAVAETPAPAAATPAPVVIDETSRLFGDSFEGGSGELLWQPFSGTWEVRDGAFVQTNTAGFDFSAGSRDPFSSLQSFRVTLRHLEGVGGGVVFNMARPDSLANAVLVRYIDADTLTWGYFTAEGGFVGLDGRKVAAPGDAPHTIGIVLDPPTSTYSILLDGAPVAGGIAYQPAGQHIGLTSSQSAVAFESVEVFGGAAVSGPSAEAITPEVTTEAVATTAIDLSTITGAWINEGGVITQSSEAAVDSIAGVGVAAEIFTVNVSILLPDSIDDAGAGLVFHMTGRDAQAGGQMVRFASGGREIFWGSFDDSGAFQGQGGAPLDLAPGVPHTMTLRVRAGAFDIAVDGETLVTDVPLTTTSGWIGLIAFRGPVVFSDFVLTLEGG